MVNQQTEKFFFIQSPKQLFDPTAASYRSDWSVFKSFTDLSDTNVIHNKNDIS